MKIAIFGVNLNPTTPSGGERRRIELARRLEERGYDVTLYALNTEVSVAWKGIKFPSKIEKYPQEPIEADFIFAADIVTRPYINKAKGRKIWMFSYYWPSTEEYLAHRPMLKLAQSSWHADWLKRKYDQEAVRAIGGVDTTFFNPPGPSIRYNQEGRTNTILAQTGQWHKGYKLVELAFSNIKQNGFKLEPLLAQDQYELREKYRKALFFISAENYPVFCWNNPAAEAMACGCPVIVLDHPAIKDHCLHKKTAEVVSCRVPSISGALATAMQKLIEHEDYRRKLSEAAWKYIHNFSYEKVVDEIEEQILKSPKRMITPKLVATQQFLKLNLGCGEKKMEGYINIDKRKEVNPDLQIDLEDAKLPYEENSVDEIYTSHLLEHITNFNPLIEEMYRVLKPNAKILIFAPYGLSEGGIRDSTHVRWLAVGTFDYFDKSNPHLYNIYKYKTDLKVIKAERKGDDIFGKIDLYFELQAIKNKAIPIKLKTKKRITFFPSNNINAGGSRHSCYQVADGLRKLGYETTFDTDPDTSVAVFEKNFYTKLAADLKRRGAKIVLVCCDPLWLTGLNGHILAFLKVADCVVVSSKRLAKWYKGKVKKVAIIPEGFDWKNVPQVEKEPKLTLCWHGTSYTINHGCLEPLLEPLNRLHLEFDFDFKIIVDSAEIKLPKFDFEPRLVQWELDSFLPEIAKCHIGINPELQDEWCSYKSYGKMVSYMGLGLPPVATWIDSYSDIIKHGVNGFLIINNDPDHWYQALKTLITHQSKRMSLEQEGIAAAQNYTLENIAARWDELIKTL